jgi:hypothetical protein
MEQMNGFVDVIVQFVFTRLELLRTMQCELLNIDVRRLLENSYAIEEVYRELDD